MQTFMRNAWGLWKLKAWDMVGGDPGLLGQLKLGIAHLKLWVVIPAPEGFANTPRLGSEPSGCRTLWGRDGICTMVGGGTVPEELSSKTSQASR